MAEMVEKVNSQINGFVWGVPMIALFLFTGVFFTVKTGFFQIKNIRLILKKTVLALFTEPNATKSSDKKAISQFQALSTALAGTIGTGSLVGVATAIAAGGRGAVFWMWVSAFFGMMTNYAEIVLGIKYRYKNQNKEWIGGPMLYIENGLGCKWLAVAFAVLCVGASFGIGNMSQVNSIAQAVYSTFGISKIAVGIAVASAIAVVLIGGITRIGRLAEKTVPFIALAYTAITLYIIIISYKRIPSVMLGIVADAFDFKSVQGGALGYGMFAAMKNGFARGIFSNEAGLGSSVIVHSAADVKHPAEQGVWGIVEVFADTMLVCTCTALVLLVSDAAGTGKNGSDMTIAAFSQYLGSFGEKFVAVAISVFAFCTLLGWSYYGERALEYLAGVKAAIYYKIIFVFFILIGSTASVNLVWEISDTLNGLMALPNLIAILMLSGDVFKITQEYKRANLCG
ncbi:MAG TPA: sodium:alanine symporter family protein [Ruminococcaceae bacterium]|nr:sodium:alanine symporter family protein [Oscillospiraceae bacterium]